MTNASVLNNLRVIRADTGESVNVSCDDCRFAGHKNIRVSVRNNRSRKSRIEWINSVLAIKTRVLAAKKNISNTTGSMHKDDFYFQDVYVVRPEIYFSSLNELKFYRLNKNLNKNAALKNTDILPLNLVKYGHPSQVIFNKNGIRLTGTAVPVKNGKYNELIRLKRKNNTIITGKVVNFNKVKVDL